MNKDDEKFVAEAMYKIMNPKEKKIQIKRIRVEKVTGEILSECLLIAAKLVQECGDDYLPLFTRVKRDLENLEQENEVKNLALSLTNKSQKPHNK